MRCPACIEASHSVPESVEVNVGGAIGAVSRDEERERDRVLAGAYSARLRHVAGEHVSPSFSTASAALHCVTAWTRSTVAKASSGSSERS